MELTRTSGAEPNFQKKKLTLVKNHFDEPEERIDDGEKNFKYKFITSAVNEKFNVWSSFLLYPIACMFSLLSKSLV